jgi:hypothetical protein
MTDQDSAGPMGEEMRERGAQKAAEDREKKTPRRRSTEAGKTANEQGKPPELATWQLHVRQVHEYSDKAEFYANQYQQVGHLVDMWGDLIEGYGAKAAQFGATFEAIQTSREIPSMSKTWGKLYATGFFAPSRWMQFYWRDPVTITVYVAKQGNDLYVSWRAFLQGKISEFKQLIWVALAAVAGLPFAFRADCPFGCPTYFHLESWFIAALVAAVVLGVLGAGYGFLYRQGDFAALLRQPLNELQFDDVTALTDAIHTSLIQAANQLNIDTKKFEAREPFYKARRTSRF